MNFDEQSAYQETCMKKNSWTWEFIMILTTSSVIY